MAGGAGGSVGSTLEEILSSELDPAILLPQEKECPLCHRAVRYFYINLNEKFLMCENTVCDFPFGCEELKFQKDENEESDVDEYIKKLRAPKLISIAPSNDTDYQPDSSQPTSDTELNLEVHDGDGAEERTEEQIQKEKDIEKNIEDMKQLNEELSKIQGGPDGRITNMKWIENLKNLQQFSGMTLLKPEEMHMLQKENTLGKLRIDIGNGNEASSSSTIFIEVHNQEVNGITEEDNGEGNEEDNEKAMEVAHEQ